MRIKKNYSLNDIKRLQKKLNYGSFTKKKYNTHLSLQNENKLYDYQNEEIDRPTKL